MLLTKEQKAKLVWELSIDVENKPMLTAIEIIIGEKSVKEINNLVYKYDEGFYHNKYKTLKDFIEYFDDNIDEIPENLKD